MCKVKGVLIWRGEPFPNADMYRIITAYILNIVWFDLSIILQWTWKE